MENSLSIVVPAFNEERSIIQCLEGILFICQSCPGPYEIIVVNDGSSDKTEALAQEFAKKYPQIRVVSNQKNMGLGGAFKRGLNEAKMKYCTLFGAVNTGEKNSFRELYAKTGTTDLILPYIANPQIRPPLRRTISTVYVKLVNFLFGYHLKFYNSGIYPTEILRETNFTNSHGFFIEILIRLLDEGLSYQEVPILLQPRLHEHSNAFRLKNVLMVVWTLPRLFVRRRLINQKNEKTETVR